MYSNRSNRWMKHLDFTILDMLVMQLVYVISFIVRHGLLNPYARPVYHNGALIMAVAGFVFSVLSENYRNILKRDSIKELKETVKYVLAMVMLLALYLLMTQTTYWYSRTVFVLLIIIGIPAIYVERSLWKKIILRQRRKNGYAKRRMILVTTTDWAKDTKERLEQKSLGDISVSGLVLTDGAYQTGDLFNGVKIVGSIADFTDNIVNDLVDEVMFVLPKGQTAPENVLDDLLNMGITAHISIAELYHSERGMQTVEKISGYTVITQTIKIASSFQLALKRLMDIVGALVGLVFTGILVIIIGPIIYFSDPGPIFFSQKRVGKNGRLFKIYKFRSMYQDAEERKKELMSMNTVDSVLMFKADNDPRIIGSGKDGSKHGIGWFIRKTSLDEFPQFWNVLRGEMSLVGTRPPLVDEWKNYEKHHRARLAVRPGITGMWQVSGRSDITDFEEVIKLDMKYIDEWSIFEDIKILFLTVKEVFSGEGSK
ncbi:exopolysaccharide biosynthesis polyprenyl glycosylphosphotransferase [Ligilactobacillus sp. WC1T17]|uniref:Exopolysaccharide biosynthesis polyprenyl glycosylphosphotransferase n=2 Tax=Ligilactobacillus TaxID=2767887 RepID=A0ABY1A8T7_9LACO|nr:exopolysaccharide biosynthesis polyprenyl glycosylphosphotransferase [Ligilactobacillus ruminis]